MGGFGIGRRAQDGPGLTDDLLSVDVRWLQRTDALVPGDFYNLRFPGSQKPTSLITVRVGSSGLTLNYQHRGAGGQCHDLECEVELAWTPCHYGGKRTWFVCPEARCGRRVAKLYLGGEGSFACRHCSGLAYASQRKHPVQRAKLRAGKIGKKLGWPTGILNQSASKPKGMHWKTYWRLRAQHDALVLVVLEGGSKRLEMVNKRLARLRDHLETFG